MERPPKDEKAQRLKTWQIWVIGVVSVLVLTPYVLLQINSVINVIFPDLHMKRRFSDFPHIATITVSGFDGRAEYAAASELLEARIAWALNQKTEWERYGRRGYETLDYSQDDRIKLIFGYDEGFDIDSFAEEIVKTAQPAFRDSEGNQVFDSGEVVSAELVYEGAYHVALEMTANGMRGFLTAAGGLPVGPVLVKIDFAGSVASDEYSLEARDSETILVKGFVNDGSAQAIVRLFETTDAPEDLTVKLEID